MKAITLTQPWATLVVIGAKTIETRSWSTDYRGPLAIHAAKGFPRWAKDLCTYHNAFRAPLVRNGIRSADELPRGVIVAICNLVDCKKILGKEDEPGCPEIWFGDYTPGRYAWILRDVCPVTRPSRLKERWGCGSGSRRQSWTCREW